MAIALCLERTAVVVVVASIHSVQPSAEIVKRAVYGGGSNPNCERILIVVQNLLFQLEITNLGMYLYVSNHA